MNILDTITSQGPLSLGMGNLKEENLREGHSTQSDSSCDLEISSELLESTASKFEETEADKESLEFWLNPTEPDPIYVKVPDELMEIVTSICQQESIQYPAVIQAVDNYKHLLVTGVNVESIHELIAAAVASKLPQFKILTQNRDGPVLAKQMARDDVPVVDQSTQGQERVQ